METWNSVSCTDLEITKREDSGVDATIVDALVQMGAYGDPFVADIVTAGLVPGEFFDRLAPGGSNFILGVTFTLVFVDPSRRPTDANGDGWYDTAVKEIYYNDAFTWSLTGTDGIDLESVALHENGHALGLGHFGNLFVTEANGRSHAAPHSVMNAAYTGVMRQPRGTDRAAFCGTYATWPVR